MSELLWLNLYILTTIISIFYCDITLNSLSFFILGFASLEFSFGILIFFLYKNTNTSLNLEYNNKYNNKNIFNKYCKIPVEYV